MLSFTSVSRSGARSPAGARLHPITHQPGPVRALQRRTAAACACGGGCPRCQTQAQPKLMINEPGDRFEQEADGIADRLVSMSAASAPGPKNGQRAVQLQYESGTKDQAQRLARAKTSGDAAPSSAVAPKIVHDVLASPGAMLDGTSRTFFEPRFGYDFSRVRVHSDAQAAASAQAVSASAFTVGHDIVFAAGQFAPRTQAGRRLLAHELTHVAQQAGSDPAPRLQRQAAGPAAPSGPAPASSPAPGPASGLSDAMLRQIARQLREAMEGWGTDEDSIYAALSGRTPDQVNEIGRVYNDMYQRDLQADLQDELSDSELKHLATVLVGPPSQPDATPDQQASGLADVVAVQLDKAMSGLGTDETSIYSALTGRTVDERKAIKDAYKRLTKNDLETDLRDEMSGSELNRALMLLNQGMQQPEDEIYFAIAGLGTDEDTIFRVLSELSADATALQALEQNYNAKYGDLIADLRDDLSSSEYEKARGYFRPTLHDADVQDCDPSKNPLQTTASVRDAHDRGMEMLNNAISMSANTSDPAVQSAAQMFNITLPPTTADDKIAWAHVQLALNTMRSADSEVTYECEPEQNFWNGACISGNIAVSLGNIHLCPRWWTRYTTVDERAYILVHEWGHKFGTGVNRIFETYCDSADFAKLPAEKLVQMPDAYAGYVLQLATGQSMPCL